MTALCSAVSRQHKLDKITFAKLYTTKTPITAAGLLNDRLLQYFEQYELPMMLRILTDRGTEYYGRVDQHDYQLYLRLMILINPKQKPYRRKYTVSVNASTGRF
ncbi:hypothetical protein SAMN05216302_10149 [Nitrosomonas aestuarii]|uniref:Integrase core domain-containing protein n=1 Tax=Nitrosomonas aestuarii TaxID=52441 RepID=A0A1I4BYV8_9PROT|nr:hypothetical protein SAMN05216302_10149 [Nitrosomonas aestuarii]